MRNISQFSCCAAIMLAIGFTSAVTVAQDDPFGSTGEAELEAAAALDPVPAEENPFAENGQPAGATPQGLCRCVGSDILAPSVVNIRQALRKPLNQSGLDFNDQPLEEVANLLQDEYDIPVKIDTNALEEIGLSPEEPVTVNLHNISLRAALRLMLKELGLTYIVRNEVLMITTPDVAEQELEICVYDVRDLIDASKPAEVESLVDTIVACVATETWADNGGGEAEIRPLKPGLLVVSQMQAIHDEIRDLLETIRLTKAAPVAKTAAIEPAAAPTTPAGDDANVVTRSYYLQIHQPSGGSSFAQQVRELITDSLPDEQWAGRLDSGEPVVLTVLPDRIVLRHREAVQDKVQSLLKESDIAYPASNVAGSGGGGFGGGGGGFFSPQHNDSD